jgi:hypothetical protein
MRYVYSDMITHIKKVANWIDAGDKTEEEIIQECCDKSRVYDSDYGGWRSYYFGFSSGKFYKVYHEWYITEEPEWELDNYYDINEIPREEAMPHICNDRDWIVIW